MKINLPTTKVATTPNRIWNYFRDGVTQSFISKFLTCKRQCYLEYVEGWTPIKTDPNLLFGTLLHGAIAASLQAKKDITSSYISSDPLGKELVNDPKTKDIFYTQVEILLQVYWLNYANDFSQEWNQIEQPFRIAHNNTYLSGVIDGGYITPEGKYWLMDTKGLSVITPDNLLATLPYDLQVMFYLYAEYLSGRKPCGLVYNIVRKPQIKVEPLETYRSRLYAAIAKDIGHYFVRMPIQITEGEVMQWYKEVLEPIMYEIEHWQINGYIPRYYNPTAILTRYHKLATTYPIITHNDYSNFYQREAPFREIVE